jgi:kinetochore protein Spc7/SPC105
VREIETETFEDNPPLFREYMSATPEFRVLMDNQFKNVKAHARLLSKAMWYEWRMKLQDGLKEGLLKTVDGMVDDEELLKRQEDLAATVLPSLLSRHDSLAQERDILEDAAEELASCDPAELENTRSELAGLESDLEGKKKLIAKLQQQLESDDIIVRQLTQQKEKCVQETTDAEKIREECRGWTTSEINTLKGELLTSRTLN